MVSWELAFASWRERHLQMTYLIGLVHSVLDASLVDVGSLIAVMMVVAKYLVIGQHIIDNWRVSIGALQYGRSADSLDSK